MDDLLKQLGELFLGSMPTIVFFLLLVVAYGLLVRRPLDTVLGERRKRTSGAIEQAREAISVAESETTVFEDKLRAARTELFQAREQRLKQLATERDAALAAARTETQAKVAAARVVVEQSAAAGRQQIESFSAELSAQVLKAILPAGVAGAEATQ
jgi:F-type H+-transporting ATPase subunit b